MLSRI